MDTWFTIKNSAGLEWSNVRHAFTRAGTMFEDDADAYDVAVEIPEDGISIVKTANHGGRVQRSTVWTTAD